MSHSLHDQRPITCLRAVPHHQYHVTRHVSRSIANLHRVVRHTVKGLNCVHVLTCQCARAELCHVIDAPSTQFMNGGIIDRVVQALK